MAPSSARQWLVLSALLVLAPSVYASVGDRLYEYRNCVSDCITAAEIDEIPIPLHRRLLFWTTPSECSYVCQHQVTNARVSQDHPIVQFHGKWPFYRIFGMQEPLSVLFSLLNLGSHLYGYNLLTSTVPSRHPTRTIYLGFPVISMLAWAFSAIYHARDFVATERMDYFLAGAGVLYGFWYSIVRLMGLDDARINDNHQQGSTTSSSGAGSSLVHGSIPPPSLGQSRMGLKYKCVSTGRQKAALVLWTRVCMALYAGHVAFLSLWRWDYTYNMTANVIIGLLGNIAWITYSIRRYIFVQRTSCLVEGRKRNDEATRSGNLRSNETIGANRSSNHSNPSQKLSLSNLVESVWPLWAVGAIFTVSAAMTFELMDFPPMAGLLDAHALWHASTILPMVVWYEFLVRDLMWDVKLGLVPPLPATVTQKKRDD